MHSVFYFSERSLNRVVHQKQKVFSTFCFCYVHLKLEILNAIRKRTKNLTDKTKKINQSIFRYLYVYTNNAYRYFSTVLRAALKNVSTRPNSCTSSLTPPEIRTFFGKSHLIRVIRVLHLPHSYLILKNLSQFARCYVAPQGKIRGPHTPVLNVLLMKARLSITTIIYENSLQPIVKEIRKQKKSNGAKSIKSFHDNAGPHCHSDVINYLTKERINIISHRTEFS